MENCSPYEYYDGVLGIQARYLSFGRDSCNETLGLLSDRALRLRIENGNIVKLRSKSPNNPMLVRYDSLPQSWQDLLVRKFGEPRRMVSKSLFDMEYRREARFFEELCRLELPNGRRLNDHDIDKYTANASVLMTMVTNYH